MLLCIDNIITVVIIPYHLTYFVGFKLNQTYLLLLFNFQNMLIVELFRDAKKQSK